MTAVKGRTEAKVLSPEERIERRAINAAKLQLKWGRPRTALIILAQAAETLARPTK